MADMIQISDDHLETLRRCGGYYECSKDRDGHRSRLMKAMADSAGKITIN